MRVVIVKSTESQVISQLKQHSTTSTLLLIDAESCHTKTMEECPPLLLTIVDLLKQGLITNVVPIGKKKKTHKETCSI